jgi:hypothetical protein
MGDAVVGPPGGGTGLGGDQGVLGPRTRKPWGTRGEQVELVQPMLFPSVYNNPVLALPSNFGGKDGDRAYPIHYVYSRANAGVGRHYDTRDFVNHNLDARSNDYTPRLVPDPSTINNFKTAAGFTPPNPNGTTNVYNPIVPLHGLPPLQNSRNYFIQSV